MHTVNFFHQFFFVRSNNFLKHALVKYITPPVPQKICTLSFLVRPQEYALSNFRKSFLSNEVGPILH